MALSSSTNWLPAQKAFRDSRRCLKEEAVKTRPVELLDACAKFPRASPFDSLCLESRGFSQELVWLRRESQKLQKRQEVETASFAFQAVLTHSLLNQLRSGIGIEIRIEPV